jgi:hypothetical protein
MPIHKQLYERELVRDIMISTAICIRNIMTDESNTTEEEIIEIIEEHYCDIIDDTIEPELGEDEDEL